jgi:EPS-associated MarR family transcriptional regulator
MPLNSQDFHILDTLHTEEITSQRQLSEHTGISLGQINYVLKRLLEKGLVKIGNFKRNPKKFGYAYLLTPKGIETKSRLAVRFVMARLEEYRDLEQRLVQKLEEIGAAGHRRLIFVGPEIVKDFVEKIGRDNSLGFTLVGHYRNVTLLQDNHITAFDVALLFDDTAESVRKVVEETGIPMNKLLPLM